MAEVVGQREGFRKVLVEPEGAGERPRDLADLDGVGESGPVMIAFVVNEDLGLMLQAAEGRGMDDPVTVALEIAPGRRRRLGVQAPAAPHRVASVRSAPALAMGPHATSSG